jgi:hypothetical protein
VTRTVPAGGVFQDEDGRVDRIGDRVEDNGSTLAAVILVLAALGLVLGALGVEKGLGCSPPSASS